MRELKRREQVPGRSRAFVRSLLTEHETSGIGDEESAIGDPRMTQRVGIKLAAAQSLVPGNTP
jgi:hypothetical protein